MLRFLRSAARLSFLVLFFLLSVPLVRTQDASTGAIRGSVLDPDGRAIAAVTVAVRNPATGAHYSMLSDADSRFALELLPPGDYSARAEIKGMTPQVTPQNHVDVGGVAEIQFRSCRRP